MDLSNFFPAAPSYLPGLLGEEQARLARQQAQQQGLLGAALGLMQAGAPSRTPISTGQALAQGLAAGQQAYGNVLQQRTQEALISQQLAEQQRKLQQQQAMRQLFPTIFQTTTERGAMAGEEGPIPTAQQRISIDPQRLSLLAAMSSDPFGALSNIAKTIPELRRAGLTAGGMEGADPFAPFMASENPNIRTVAAQYSRAYQSGAIDEATAGQRAESLAKMVEATQKAPSSELANYDRVVAQARERGETPPTLVQYQESLRRAGAQPLEVKIGPPTATKLIDAAIERANASELAAGGAAQTLRTISDLKPVLSAGVLSGPLSGQTAVVARLASSLGVTGQNTQELLNRTSLAMQRLASLELSAAEQMRGQGAITEGERALIARAAGGNLQSLTVGEVNSLLDALERTAKFKIQGHQANVRRLRNILPEETRSFAEGYTTDFDLGSAPEVRQQAGSAARAAGLVR